MKKNPKVSIIIPSRNVDEYTEKCIKECLKLDYDNFEIILSLGVKNKTFKDKRVRVIEAGEVTPAFKRNLGMEKAKGEFFAFVDSDAYPKKDWLKKAIKYFKDEKIGIVGGPNLTPPEGNFWEKISGYVLANFWISGFADVRYKIGKNQFVKELPSCNYVCRKKIAPKYSEGYLTAEDSKFCFDVTKQGYKILYAGDVIVYHHRRNSFKKHVKQMFIYGRDIAWLLKESPSLDMLYFSVLSIFVLGFLAGAVLSVFFPVVRIIFLILCLIYFWMIAFTSVHESLKVTLCVIFTSIITHFAYGLGFFYGTVTRNKKSVYAK